MYNQLKVKLSGLGLNRLHISSGVWLGLEKIVRVIVSFGVLIPMARYLGPEAYGKYSYVLSIIAMALPIMNLGLETVVIKEFSKADRSDWGGILGTCFFMQLIVRVALMPILWWAHSLMYPNDLGMQSILIVMSLASFLSMYYPFEYLWRARVFSKQIAIISILGLVISSALRIAGIKLKLGLDWFVTVYFVEQMLAFLLFLGSYLLERKHFNIRWKLEKVRIKSLLVQSWPLLFAFFAISIYLKIDQVMLQNIHGNQAVGIYAAATRLSEFWYFLPYIVGITLFPEMARQHEANYKAYVEMLQKWMGIFFWVFILAGIATCLISNPLINLLYGPEYHESSNILRVHMFTGAIVSMGIFFNNKFTYDNKNYIFLTGSVIGAVVNVILNYFFIPIWGGTGAAFASVLSYISPIIINSLIFDREIGKIYLRSVCLPLTWLKRRV